MSDSNCTTLDEFRMKLKVGDLLDVEENGVWYLSEVNRFDEHDNVIVSFYEKNGKSNGEEKGTIPLWENRVDFPMSKSMKKNNNNNHTNNNHGNNTKGESSNYPQSIDAIINQLKLTIESISCKNESKEKNNSNHIEESIELLLETIKEEYEAIKTENVALKKDIENKKEIIEKLMDDQKCVVCMIKEKLVLFIPCKHQIICEDCNKNNHKITECILCRTTIRDRIIPFK